MSKYISVDKMTEKLKEVWNDYANAGMWQNAQVVEYVIKLIERIPVANVEEVRHGKWIEDETERRDDGEIYDYCCSLCKSPAEEGSYGNRDVLTPFCSQCGAEMDKEFWCDNQQLDENHKVICLANLAEGRALQCPYKDVTEREAAEYPCSDYKPKVDVSVEEVRHGEWIRKRQFVYECSLCKRIELVEGVRRDCDLKSEHKILLSMYPYCHCGAKMDKVI